MVGRRDNLPKNLVTADCAGTAGSAEAVEGWTTSATGIAGGAGDAGLDSRVGPGIGEASVFDDRGSNESGAGELDVDLASRIPPPDVTNGLSAVFLRQNDHLGLTSSP